MDKETGSLDGEWAIGFPHPRQARGKPMGFALCFPCNEPGAEAPICTVPVRHCPAELPPGRMISAPGAWGSFKAPLCKGSWQP